MDVMRVASMFAATVAAVFALPLGAHAFSGDRASGSVRLGDTHYLFRAISAPDGSSPSGRMSRINPDGVVQANVTCLLVEADGEAAMQGLVTRSTNPAFPPGTLLVYFVDDNGNPGRDNDRFDAGTFGPTIPPDECINFGAFLPIEAGNIRVVDN